MACAERFTVSRLMPERGSRMTSYSQTHTDERSQLTVPQNKESVEAIDHKVAIKDLSQNQGENSAAHHQNALEKKTDTKKQEEHQEILSNIEIEMLKELEYHVNASYLNSCEALLKIERYEDGRLWRVSGRFKQFADYVKSRFGFTKKHCKLLIRSANFIRKLKSRDVEVAIPVRESHIRPIIQKLETEEEQMEFWDEFCRRNEVNPQSVGKIKASDIRSSLNDFKLENEEDDDGDEDENIKNSKKGIRIINRLKKVAEQLPNYNEISEKIEEIEELLAAN